MWKFIILFIVLVLFLGIILSKRGRKRINTHSPSTSNGENSDKIIPDVVSLTIPVGQHTSLPITQDIQWSIQNNTGVAFLHTYLIMSTGERLLLAKDNGITDSISLHGIITVSSRVMIMVAYDSNYQRYGIFFNPATQLEWFPFGLANNTSFIIESSTNPLSSTQSLPNSTIPLLYPPPLSTHLLLNDSFFPSTVLVQNNGDPTTLTVYVPFGIQTYPMNTCDVQTVYFSRLPENGYIVLLSTDHDSNVPSSGIILIQRGGRVVKINTASPVLSLYVPN